MTILFYPKGQIYIGKPLRMNYGSLEHYILLIVTWLLSFDTTHFWLAWLILCGTEDVKEKKKHCTPWVMTTLFKNSDFKVNNHYEIC